MTCSQVILHVGPVLNDLTRLTNDLRELGAGNMPSRSDLNACPLLDQWSLGFIKVPCIVGDLRQHPTLGNLSHIHTSELVFLDPRKRWVRTRSKFYRLGKPSSR
jgi:hypothetical protein